MIDSISGGGTNISISVQPIKSTNVVDTNQVADGESVEKSDCLTTMDNTSQNTLNLDKKDKKKELSKEDVANISDALNKLMEEANCGIEFDYCEDLERMTMKVVDKKTKEVIKQFPPQKMLDVLTGIHNWIGVLLDEKV
jgi:flagellar protein FlaG